MVFQVGETAPPSTGGGGRQHHRTKEDDHHYHRKKGEGVQHRNPKEVGPPLRLNLTTVNLTLLDMA